MGLLTCLMRLSARGPVMNLYAAAATFSGSSEVSDRFADLESRTCSDPSPRQPTGLDHRLAYLIRARRSACFEIIQARSDSCDSFEVRQDVHHLDQRVVVVRAEKYGGAAAVTSHLEAFMGR